jgi:hypothetical protein
MLQSKEPLPAVAVAGISPLMFFIGLVSDTIGLLVMAAMQP